MRLHCIHSSSCSSLLQDDAKALKEYGVHSKTRLLVMRTAQAAASKKLATQEDRALRLTRLRDAAAAVASRGDGRSASCCLLELASKFIQASFNVVVAIVNSHHVWSTLTEVC